MARISFDILARKSDKPLHRSSSNVSRDNKGVAGSRLLPRTKTVILSRGVLLSHTVTPSWEVRRNTSQTSLDDGRPRVALYHRWDVVRTCQMPTKVNGSWETGVLRSRTTKRKGGFQKYRVGCPRKNQRQLKATTALQRRRKLIKLLC